MAYSVEKTLPGLMKISSYYSAAVETLIWDLPHRMTKAIGKYVSRAINEAKEAVISKTLQSFRNIFKRIATRIPICHSQYQVSAGNRYLPEIGF